MDYKRLSIYNLKKDSIFNGNILKTQGNYKYEILEFPIGRQYEIVNGSVAINNTKFPLKKKFKKVFASISFLFICYDRTLEMYNLNSNDLVKRIESSEDIVCGTGGFLVVDGVHYILNYFGETVFVVDTSDVLDFTVDGTVVSISGGSHESPIDSDVNLLSGCLLIQNLKKRTTYDHGVDPVMEFEEIKVYKNTTRIDDIVSCSNIKLELLDPEDAAESVRLIKSNENRSEAEGRRPVFLDCIIVLCKHCIYIVYDDLIIQKKIEHSLTSIIPERFVIHNFVQEISLYDCILTINCFKSIRLYKHTDVESFLVHILNSKQVGIDLCKKFINGLKINSNPVIPYNTILCRSYRQVDDRLKNVLDTIIEIDRLSVDELYYLIIYKDDLTEAFVKMCKDKKRLFYLVDLKLFFEKTGRSDELKAIFLKHGILIFEYQGLEKLLEIEKCEIASQKACFISAPQ